MTEMIDREICKQFMIWASHSFAHYFYHSMKTLVDRLGEEEAFALGKEFMWAWAQERGKAKREALAKKGLANTPENYWQEPHPNTVVFKQPGQKPEDLYIKNTEEEVIKETRFCSWEDAFSQRPDALSQKIKELYCNNADWMIWNAFNPAYEVVRVKTFAKDGCCRLRFTKTDSK
jgi:hypothetical protein